MDEPYHDDEYGDDTDFDFMTQRKLSADLAAARAEIERMKSRPAEIEYGRLDLMWNQLVKERDSARKWAKLWKMQATGERIQKEQCIDALADVTHERNKLLDQKVVSRVNINSAHKEIERLNGRRCKDCKKSNDYLGGDTVYCNKQYAPVIVMGDHYCKSWEKR